jgi:hypothetical protein
MESHSYAAANRAAPQAEKVCLITAAFETFLSMRLSLALFLCLLLAGCPSPKSTTPSVSSETPGAPPIPSPTPKQAPSVVPLPTPQPAPTPSPVEFTGVWTTTDEQGQVFDIAIFPNGQVVSNWTKSKGGAYGERGLWRRDGSRLLLFYSNGSSDVMEPTADGLTYTEHASGAPLDRSPANSAAARRLSDAESKFIGVWRLNREPDGTYQYLSLQSNGRAFSTVNGGTEGKWTISNGAAECVWPDGWVDRIELTSDGWQKRSSVGSATTGDAPADLSPALRVGETPFEVSP